MSRAARGSISAERLIVSAVVACVIAAGGEPTQAGQIIFGKQQVIARALRAAAVFSIDLDGDSDEDVVSACFSCADFLQPSLHWFRNDGKRGVPGFEFRWFSGFPPRHALDVHAADLDGDGDVDLLSAKFLLLVGGEFAWHESDGGDPPVFRERRIFVNFNGDADVVRAADLDGDGDMDVYGSSRRDDRILWFQNDGGSPPTFRAFSVTEDPDGIGPGRPMQGFADGVGAVWAADLDGDGDLDLLSASGGNNRIAWWENDGGETPFFEPHVISDGALGASRVVSADLDGDGDLDVVSTSLNDDKVAWYENDGGMPPAFTEHVITQDPDGPGGPLEGIVDGAQAVRAADLDGDGDMDLVVGANQAGRVIWFENQGGIPVNFTPHMITDQALRVVAIDVTDLDRDGDLDVLSASFLDGKIAWYENIAVIPSQAVGPPEPIGRPRSEPIQVCQPPLC